MPPPPNANKKKKKKGHAPAHQNSFAYTHNPKSKKTANILASPIQHVCRRCNDKLVWRKQYRKYKPLTQPSKCNHCQKRNVKAAYHTICSSCTQNSVTSQKLLAQWSQESAERAAAAAMTEETVGTTESAIPENDDESSSCAAPRRLTYTRVCAMCVKEPALGSVREWREDNEDEASQTMGRKLKLREIKTLERQAERRAMKPKQQMDSDEEDIDEEDDEVEPDDALAQAVGGADKLLTGDAYREMLLRREEERQLQ